MSKNQRYNINNIAFYILIIFCLGTVASQTFSGIVVTKPFTWLLFSTALYSLLIIYNRIEKGYLNINTLLLCLLCLSLLFSVLLQMLIYPNLQETKVFEGRYAHPFLVKTTVTVILYIFIGYLIGGYNIGSKNNFSIFLLIIALFLLTLPLIGSDFTIDYSRAKVKIDHLYAGDSYYILLIFATAYSKIKNKWFIILCSTILLFILGGRGNLLVYILTIFCYTIFLSKRKTKIFFLFFFTLIGFFLFIYFQQIISFLLRLGLNNRMLLIGGVEADPSQIERNQQISVGISRISEYFFVGNISDLIIANGSIGTYMHNFMSILQYYGIIPFVLYITLILLSLSKLFIDIKFLNTKINLDRHSNIQFRIIFLLSGIIGILTVKQGIYTILMIAFGIYSRCINPYKLIYQKYRSPK